MGKKFTKILDPLNLFTSNKAPAAPVVIVSPAPVAGPEAQVAAKQEDGSSVDPAARLAAEQRLQQERLRRGRSKLRTDLFSGNGSGAGVAIPS